MPPPFAHTGSSPGTPIFAMRIPIGVIENGGKDGNGSVPSVAAPPSEVFSFFAIRIPTILPETSRIQPYTCPAALG